jgi:hypothetical protein
MGMPVTGEVVKRAAKRLDSDWHAYRTVNSAGDANRCTEITQCDPGSISVPQRVDTCGSLSAMSSGLAGRPKHVQAVCDPVRTKAASYGQPLATGFLRQAEPGRDEGVSQGRRETVSVAPLTLGCRAV